MLFTKNSMTLAIRYVRPDQDRDIPLPTYMTAGASGMDIASAAPGEVALEPGEIRLIPTGFAVAIPAGYEAQIRPRSGLAARYGITLINSPGTIDADYRGEIQVPLINLGKSRFTVNRGDRIAQMVIQPVCRMTVRLTDRLDDTGRQAGGFGHTGS